MWTILITVLIVLSVIDAQDQCTDGQLQTAAQAADNICSTDIDCEVNDMTMSIETVNADEVRFIFVTPGGVENVVTDVITEVDEWVYSEASHPGPVESSDVEMVWGSDDFMYTNLSVSACSHDCHMEYCHEVQNDSSCESFTDVSTDLESVTNQTYTAAELEAAIFTINKGERLCIRCVTGKPFRIRGGSMTVIGHDGAFTYTVTYHGVTSPRIPSHIAKSSAGKFPVMRPIKRNIDGAGFRVTKIYISADKDITVTNLKLDLCK